MISTALTIIAYGGLLSVGFWGGKKLTNQIDFLVYTKSKKFKEFFQRRD